jgi:ferric-dicitrate binding protein FerR (iron transport regulator)
MSAPCEEIRPELEALLAAVTDGTLDPAGRKRLAQILREHPEARQAWFDHCQMHALLVSAHGTLQALAPPARPLRRILAFAAAALLLAALGLWRALAPAALDARLVPAQGSAWIVGEDGRRSPLSDARELRDGDRVATGPDSRSELRARDGTTLVLLERSEARFRKGSRVELAQGTLRCDVTPRTDGAALVVSTPHAEAAVLGTSFELSALPAETRLRTTSGRVRFTAAGRSVEVGPGELAAADERGPVLWKPAVSLDFSGMRELPRAMEPFFCVSDVLLTRERKVVPAPERMKFAPEGLVLGPEGQRNPNGLVEARWTEEIGDDVVLEADVAAGKPWSLGLSVSGHAYEGYRIIVAALDAYPNGVAVDTIHPVELLVFARDPRPIDPGVEHTVRVERHGKRMRVWIDRDLRIDTAIDHPLPEGRRRVFSVTNFGAPPILRRLRAWRIAG